MKKKSHVARAQKAKKKKPSQTRKEKSIDLLERQYIAKQVREKGLALIT